MVRPLKSNKEQQATLTLKLPAPLLAAVREAATERQLSVSALARLQIERFIADSRLSLAPLPIGDMVATTISLSAAQHSRLRAICDKLGLPVIGATRLLLNDFIRRDEGAQQ